MTSATSTPPIVVEPPAKAVVDPHALADLMVALERLLRIGVYYPAGHPYCDQAATAVQDALTAVSPRSPTVEFEILREALYVQHADLEPEWRGVDSVRDLLQDAGIVALTMDVDIGTEDLHQFIARLLQLRQEARGARQFRQVAVTGLPRSVRARDREYLARKQDQDAETVGDERTGPGLETLLAALERRGLDRHQLELCQRFLVALPDHLEHHRLGNTQLTQTTWCDVEKLLLVRAAQHRSFEKVTASAQHLAIQKNLGELMSFFEELSDDDDVTEWHEALDLLLNLNRRTVATEPDERSATGATGQRPFVGRPASVERLCEAVAEFALAEAPPAAEILPGDHHEELAILLQVLQAEQEISSLSHIQRRLSRILENHLDQAVASMLAQGLADLLAMPVSESRDGATSLVLDTVRRVDRLAAAEAVAVLGERIEPTRLHHAWPHVINELLLAGGEVTADVHDRLVALASAWPAVDDGADWTAALAAQALRLEQLGALRQGRLVSAAAARLPATLWSRIVPLVAAIGSRPLATWLLESLRGAPPSRLAGAVLPLLSHLKERDVALLVALATHADGGPVDPELAAWAGNVLRDGLPEVPRDQRRQEWLVDALVLLGECPVADPQIVWQQVVTERRWLIFSAWPAPCRQVARSCLQAVPEPAAAPEPVAEEAPNHGQ